MKDKPFEWMGDTKLLAEKWREIPAVRAIVAIVGWALACAFAVLALARTF